ncbi:hypothetical protein LUZ60_011537 [Juncus effusus]|nr:hypothetical protein LUZ60_011537 [Juncus effusus]
MAHLTCIAILIFSLFTLSISSFTPIDNYLISCGSSSTQNISFQGKLFTPDSQNQPNFSLKTSKDSSSTFSSPNSNSNLPPIYQSLRLFTQTSNYNFKIQQTGRHWIRLHFYPLPNSTYDLLSAPLTVLTDDFVLINNFTFKNSNQTYLFKEFSLNLTSVSFSLTFVPTNGSISFVNAIEIVSAPDSLIDDEAISIPATPFIGLSGFGLETLYRLNMGGPALTPLNDSLGRFWDSDLKYLHVNSSAIKVSIAPLNIKYPKGVTTETAPALIYSTGQTMGDPNITNLNFNITWVFPINPNFRHLIRMHFCDIVSKALNMLVFNVYINYDIAIDSLDLSSLKGGLAVPYYKDFVSNSSNGLNGSNGSSLLMVSIGPDSMADFSNAILNGLEIMKISNEAKSLDGVLSIHDILPDLVLNRRAKKNRFIFALVFGSVILALILVISRYYCIIGHPKRSRNHRCLRGTSTTDSKLSILSNKPGTGTGTASFISLASTNLGRTFTFQEILKATNKFNETLILGVGGFGTVFKGTLDDGTMVAIKRGNPRSEQGLSEFQTEIIMLSKLRHKHLVSLIGFCDEKSEMILVYEYMANGPLRSHLYGSNTIKPLNWKQRLEICIGAARGLHYLHTGATSCIIHRDVKTTNILLDENLIAKVADFGLSKNGPALDQTHVSTAVKGSFGYLDPEYFRRQKLTEKSDVYSFGVVLLEIICARPALNPLLNREEVNIVEWALSWQKKGLLGHIIDPFLVGKISQASLRKYGEVCEKCLSDSGSDRPGMGDVLWNLEYCLQLEETCLNAGFEERSINSVNVEGRFANDYNNSVIGVINETADGSGTSSIFSQIVNPKGR